MMKAQSHASAMSANTVQTTSTAPLSFSGTRCAFTRGSITVTSTLRARISADPARHRRSRCLPHHAPFDPVWERWHAATTITYSGTFLSEAIRIGVLIVAEHEADRHAKKDLKKQVRGVRRIERATEGHDDVEAEVVRGYAAAVRSAITDDGRASLAAPGLKLKGRLQVVADSIDRAVEKGGSRLRSVACAT